MNYSALAFTDRIKAIQERMGSRSTYARVEKMQDREGLTEVEGDFIGHMDSVYIASLGENGYPYIQHRGGPEGFLKVIDAQTIGFVDFSGNRQYISTGNIEQNAKVSLILVSYPMRARLKIYAEAEVVALHDNPDLYNFLIPENYQFKPERMMLFHIKAYDWNCPQHITPRYSEKEMEVINKPREQYIRQLEEQVRNLQARSGGQ